MLFEDVFTALDQGHARAAALEELGQLTSDNAAAQYRHALRQCVQVEHVITGPDARRAQAGHSRPLDAGAGCYQEFFGP